MSVTPRFGNTCSYFLSDSLYIALERAGVRSQRIPSDRSNQHLCPYPRLLVSASSYTRCVARGGSLVTCSHYLRGVPFAIAVDVDDVQVGAKYELVRLYLCLNISIPVPSAEVPISNWRPVAYSATAVGSHPVANRRLSIFGHS